MDQPDYAVPKELGSDLLQLHEYWESLKRGYGLMPYGDDVRLTLLSNLEDRLFLLDRFERPDRFRFSNAGSHIEKVYGDELVGYFLDEIPIKCPLDQLVEQILATLEQGAPTYYGHIPEGQKNTAYSRLLLPFWGAGRVDMILGGVVEGAEPGS